jgi:hypothetical protein
MDVLNLLERLVAAYVPDRGAAAIAAAILGAELSRIIAPAQVAVNRDIFAALASGGLAAALPLMHPLAQELAAPLAAPHAAPPAHGTVFAAYAAGGLAAALPLMDPSVRDLAALVPHVAGAARGDRDAIRAIAAAVAMRRFMFQQLRDAAENDETIAGESIADDLKAARPELDARIAALDTVFEGVFG